MRRPGTAVDDLVAVLAAAAAGLLLLWLVVTGGASALTLVLRRRGLRWAPLDALERRVVPGLVRRAVAAGLGASVAVGLAAPAALAAVPPPAAASAVVAVSAAAGPVPVWPAESPAETPAEGSGTADPPGAPASQVVVAAGDSLWSLTAAALGPGAEAGAVAEEWPQWWAANRALIGEDPDLLQPGQVLQVPGAHR